MRGGGDDGGGGYLVVKLWRDLPSNSYKQTCRNGRFINLYSRMAQGRDHQGPFGIDKNTSWNLF